jgi:riboflavin kinase/FMN adenylyltransferase
MHAILHVHPHVHVHVHGSFSNAVDLLAARRRRLYLRAVDVFPGHRRIGRALRTPVVALGNFDGVHLGHRALLDRARADGPPGAELVALTFEPHPAAVLAPDRAPALIATLDRKLELLAAAGVDACVVEPFDHALSRLGAAEFAADILAAALGARHVAVGSEFRFGRGRSGDAAMLADLGARLGFAVTAVPPCRVGGEVASSSRVRALLAAGEVAAAAEVLGRHHDVAGEVVRGAGRGRQLGVPTANVDALGLLPRPGIYAVWVERLGAGGAPIAGAASLGTNPTFGAGALTLEVHLLAPVGDIYGERLRIRFVERLRDEERFDGVDALMTQIAADIEATRRILRQGHAV